MARKVADAGVSVVDAEIAIVTRADLASELMTRARCWLI